MSVDDKLYIKAGSGAEGAFDLVVMPETAGWAYSGLRVLTLAPGQAHTWAPRCGPAEGVPVELRGAGQASRQVNNFCSPGVFDCDKLIAVEVLTPGGNWSSFDKPKPIAQRTYHYLRSVGIGSEQP